MTKVVCRMRYCRFSVSTEYWPSPNGVRGTGAIGCWAMAHRGRSKLRSKVRHSALAIDVILLCESFSCDSAATPAVAVAIDWRVAATRLDGVMVAATRDSG